MKTEKKAISNYSPKLKNYHLKAKLIKLLHFDPFFYIHKNIILIYILLFNNLITHSALLTQMSLHGSSLHLSS